MQPRTPVADSERESDMRRFVISVADNGSAHLDIVASGELDLDAAGQLVDMASVISLLSLSAPTRGSTCTVDLTGVTFMDSSGAEALVDLQEALVRAAMSMSVRPSAPVMRVLSITGLAPRFQLIGAHRVGRAALTPAG
jgi:anti-anti-sigma factor